MNSPSGNIPDPDRAAGAAHPFLRRHSAFRVVAPAPPVPHLRSADPASGISARIPTGMPPHLHNVRHPAEMAEPEINAFLTREPDGMPPTARAGHRLRWEPDHRPGRQGRHHTHEIIIQRAVKQAVREARIVKHAGCHTFRHSGVYPALCGTTHLLEAGCDIRTKANWSRSRRVSYTDRNLLGLPDYTDCPFIVKWHEPVGTAQC